MEQTKITMEIHDGYRIEEREEFVDPVSANHILTSRRKHRYTEAKWKGDNIKLVKHVFICPRCGKEIPAYERFLYGNAGRIVFGCDEEVSAWVGLQLTFEEEKGELFFQAPIEPGNRIICPKCKQSSREAKNIMTVFVEERKDCVYVGRLINQPNEVMEIPWVTSLNLTGNFPLTERFVFNFTTGKTVAELVDAKGRLCLCSDADEWSYPTVGGELYELFQENRLVRRYVRRFFQKHWTAALPFTAEEFSFIRCRETVRFQNYPRSFYDSIPYRDDSMQIEESFLELIPDLRNAENAMAMLEKFDLPPVKSVKRCIYKSPGLLFYLHECSLLYDVLTDVNLFCDTLGVESIFYFLSRLHQYPGVQMFLEDFVRETSGRELCKCIKEYSSYIFVLGESYAVMSQKMRISVRKDWKKLRRNARNGSYLDGRVHLSLPMRDLPDKVKNQKVNGFFFRWLRTTAECKVAGLQLENCLKRWDYNDNPVVGIYLDNRLIAAAEVEGDRVIQALRYRNEEIDVFSDLHEALTKWCTVNHLTLELDDDMPF